MSSARTIRAHGGELVDRIVSDERRTEWESRRSELPGITLDARQLNDLEMIAIGAYSPLKGFMGSADHESVLNRMRLDSGTPWPIPITLSVDRDRAEALTPGEPVALEDEQGRFLAVLHLEETYSVSREQRAEAVFRTRDREHPGVQKTLDMGEVSLAGEVDVLELPSDPRFPKFRLSPAETRRTFQEREWDSVVGFQTRNPMHRAHEYIAKSALENVDGLLLHPLVGHTKKGDVPAEVRMECYRTMIEHYFPEQRVLLSVMPAKMNYAGPREAVLHALIRKNYGCTHFIVGRDHAGVGDYYGTYEAQEVFSQFGSGDLGIEPVFFDYAFWCEECGNMATKKTCPHGEENQLYLSGTRVRSMLREGESLPPEFSRPEVADILREAYREKEPTTA